MREGTPIAGEATVSIVAERTWNWVSVGVPNTGDAVVRAAGVSEMEATGVPMTGDAVAMEVAASEIVSAGVPRTGEATAIDIAVSEAPADIAKGGMLERLGEATAILTAAVDITVGEPRTGEETVSGFATTNKKAAKGGEAASDGETDENAADDRAIAAVGVPSEGEETVNGDAVTTVPPPAPEAVNVGKLASAGEPRSTETGATETTVGVPKAGEATVSGDGLTVVLDTVMRGVCV